MSTTPFRALAPAEALCAKLTLITAHSGCNGTALNSREHILEAIRSGAEAIEVDVRAQGDLLYLSHDEPDSVSACTTLAECFALLSPHGRMMINCDVKTEGLVQPVMRLAESMGFTNRILFTGECNDAIEEIYALGGELWHSMWASEHSDADMDNARETIRHTGCPALNIDYHMATDAQYTRLKETELGLSVWTVNEEHDLRRFLQMGVFNITTRRPTLALKLRDEIQGRFETRQLPLAQIVEVIRGAGKKLLAANNPGVICAKEGEGNYVSEWDIAIEQHLIHTFSALVPNAAFFSEESRADPSSTTGVRFIIDPIDGTTNFIHDYRCSTVSVAVLYDGEPLFGVVYNPYQDEMFTALRGAGAFLNGSRIRVSTREVKEAVVAVGTSPYNKQAHQESIIATIDGVLRCASDIRRCGSAAAELCNVACGRAEGYLERNLAPWDYAAGVLLIREAGGVISTFRGDCPSFAENEAIVCGNRAVYPALFAIAARS